MMGQFKMPHLGLELLVCLLAWQLHQTRAYVKIEVCNYQAVRLPTHIRPERYQIVMDPNAADMIIQGKMRIDLDVLPLDSDPTPPDEVLATRKALQGQFDWDFGQETGSSSSSRSKSDSLLPLKKRRVKRMTDDDRRGQKRPITDMRGDHKASHRAGSSSRQGAGVRGRARANHIVMNGKDFRLIELTYWELEADGGQHQVAIERVCRDMATSMVVISLAKDLEPGSRGWLDIIFESNIRETSVAFQVKEFLDFDVNRPVNSYIYTRFKTMAARLMMPCFDEPAFRAVFELSLVMHPSVDGYSVMPVQSSHLLHDYKGLSFEGPNFDNLSLHSSDSIGSSNPLVADKKLVKFQATPVIPLYMFGFIIGSFNIITRSSAGGLPIRVLTYPGGDLPGGPFIADSTVRVVNLLEDLFKCPYPGPKLDVFTLKPTIFLGVVFSNMWNMDELRMQTNAASQGKSSIVNKLIRAISQHWFTARISLKWWSDLWFNDGFSGWLAYKYTNQIYPDYDNQQLSALDSKRSLIGRVRLQNAWSDEYTFRAIKQYNQMLRGDQMTKMERLFGIIDAVSPNLFINQVVKLLAERRGQIVSWAAIFDGLPEFVEQYFAEWLRREEYPVVTVQQVDRSSHAVVLNQKVFQLDEFRPPVLNMELFPLIVIISVFNKEGQEDIKLIWQKSDRQITFQLPSWFDLAKGHWFKVNSNALGYYRVHYIEDSARMLRKNLDLARLSTTDRRNLIEDTYELALAGTINMLDLLDIVMLFEGERNPHVVRHMVNALRFIRKQYTNDETLTLIDWLITHLLGPLFNQRPINELKLLPEEDLECHIEALRLLVDSYYMPVVDALVGLYRSDPNWRTNIGLGQEDIVVEAVAGYGSQAEFVQLLESYDPVDTSPAILRALAAVAPNKERVYRLMEPIIESARTGGTEANLKATTGIMLIMRRILERSIPVERYMDHLRRQNPILHVLVETKLIPVELTYYPAGLEIPSSGGRNSARFSSARSKRMMNFEVEYRIVEEIEALRRSQQRRRQEQQV